MSTRPNAADLAIGDLLVERNLLTSEQLEEALDLCRRWQIRIGDVLLARNWVRPYSYYRTLASKYEVPFIDLTKEPADTTLLDAADEPECARRLTIPWRWRNDRLVVVTAEPGPETFLFAREKFGPNIDLAVTSKFDIIWHLQAAFRDLHSEQAVYELARSRPDLSAQRVLTEPQIVVLWLLASALLIGLAFAPVATIIAFLYFMTFFYLGNFVFKAYLVWVGSRTDKPHDQDIEALARQLTVDDLPVYTILVPMFREPEVLPILAHALRQLDYPLGKLDIKIVLEEGDDLTIDAAKRLGLEGVFEIIRVPPSQPQTKPKACNYALRFARGDLLVIFDAEDKPEPSQLRKVVAAFKLASKDTACIQCRLNFYNAEENWLTRLFTLDYSLWFDLLLPGLEALRIPIPLGGTSNHFRTEVLRELGAWDPFNVTEDADLGVRLTQAGYRVGVINSTTFEEANVSQKNWIRQRSRWIKGYLQTFLVHTRHPIHLIRTVGPLGVFGFLFFIGGTALAGLLNPLFHMLFLFWVITQTTVLDIFFPPTILYLSLINLVIGNGLFIYLAMIAPLPRMRANLVPFGITAIWYWVLMAIAAYKALWQLIVNPFYWEKTQHGISTHTAAELAKTGYAPEKLS